MRLCILLSLSLAACADPPNGLKGSLSEVYPLEFDSVTVARIESYLVIEYLKGRDGAGGKVAKLSIYVGDLTIAAGNTVDLTGTVGTNPRSTLQRVIEGAVDIGVSVGNVQFDVPPDVGATTSGSFHVTTAMPAGRTLNGDFQATVEQR